jgi:hypothetical protein
MATIKDCFESDLDDIFFDVNEFASNAVLTPLSGATSGVTGIFINQPVSIDPYTGEVKDREITFTGKSSDLGGSSHRDSLVIGSITYEIKENRPDGSGVSKLFLNQITELPPGVSPDGDPDNTLYASVIGFNTTGTSFISTNVRDVILELQTAVNASVALKADQTDLVALQSEVTTNTNSITTLQNQIGAIPEESVIRAYELNDVDDTGTGITYLGKATVDGLWLIERLTETGTDLAKDYANISNNSGQATYTDAWSNRLSLIYQEFQNLTF